jgi:hypothetical protein
MKNEIQKKEKTEVALQSNNVLAMQAQSEIVINKDTIQLPRLVLVNPMSSFKKEHEDLKDGEIVNSDDFSVVVPKKGRKSFIPLMIKQFYDTYEVTSAGKNLISREKYTGQEKDYDDAKIIKTITFDTLFVDRENPMLLPYRVTFKHGSASVGIKLLTMMYVTNKQFGKSPWAAAVNLFASTKKSKDGKEFEVIDYATDKTPLTADELANAEKWVASFMGATVESVEIDD